MHREEAIVNSSGATVDEVVPEQAEQSDAARRVAEWTMELFGLARIEALVRTEEDEEAISVRIFGRDAGRFTDRDGELLDSVQVIVNKALAFTIGKPIELDSASFKHDRTEAIGHRALEVAELVRQDGREQLLPAMSPIERRIVHIALRDVPDLTTESRGEGFFKRVAIIPKPAEPTVES
jgi:spoIIIJ-associated protein